MGPFAYILRRSGLRGLLLPGLLVMGISATAQIDTIKVAFKQLTIEDGLSQGMIYDILQDRYGFMWFATKDGLNRYDGYTFKVFRHDPKDSTSLGNNLESAPVIGCFELMRWSFTAIGCLFAKT